MSTILTAVDYKARLQPPLHPKFFGNASLDVYTDIPISTLLSDTKSCPNGAVAGQPVSCSASLAQVATKVHQSIRSITDPYLRSFYQTIVSRPRILDTQKRPLNFQYGTDVLCTSWEHIHKDSSLLKLELPPNVKSNKITFEKLRYMHTESVDGAVVVLPAFRQKWGDPDEQMHGNVQGGLEVAVSLTRKSMRRLMEDEDFRRYATWGKARGYKVKT